MTDDGRHPAGWYPDPSGRQPQRWWDGFRWTSHAATHDRRVIDDPIAAGDATSAQDDSPTAHDVSLAQPRGGERVAAVRPGAETRRLLASAQALRTRTSDCRLAPSIRRKGARAAYEAVRDRLVREELLAIPLSRLRETTEGRVRFGPIDAAGFTTVGAAMAAGV